METQWLEANQYYLAAEVARIRQRLTRAAEENSEAGDQHDPTTKTFDLTPPPALETLCAAFKLSSFESDVLLLVAALELDPQISGLCARAHGDSARSFPTFGLALATLDEPHWSALSPAAPLRFWRLIEIHQVGAQPLTTCRLSINERVLHYLVGVNYLDDQLSALIRPLRVMAASDAAHLASVHKLEATLREALEPPAIQFCGDDMHAKRAIVAATCAALGVACFEIGASDAPANANEREVLARLWEREAVMSNALLLITCEEVADTALALTDELRSAIIINCREPLTARQRALTRIDIRRLRWQSPRQLHELSHDSYGDARIEHLAQRIEAAATWDDIVLPAAQLSILREIATHVRQCAKVYNDWGFAAKSARGLGITALFTGTSGTGKTMAAEVLANDLQLDLYRIDLSAVVSKYIGETEKNLRQVFDAAEQRGAILLFDEADALFGKRSEVKDSHDRYANIEISYLLQRMEAYHGLAILTTNMKSSLDTAFMRRIRFVVHFPFPDTGLRMQIWERVFPKATPTCGLEMNKLARLNVAGGHIRNIALHAAFRATDAGQAVQMTHVLQAAHSEYAKMEKPLTEAEIADWRLEA
jgi:ATP-dependent 26S proteasome regulatory subunit